MNDFNLHVISNIIAAVESGGQIYSEDKNWTCYAGKYHNTTNEVTCTLGPWQAYGDEAQELVQYIYDHHPDVFKACDKRGLIEAKLSVSWVGTQWGPSNEQKAVLIALLATDAGHEASEYVFMERLHRYLTRAEEFGVDNVGGQMMWAEVQHLGGKDAPVRVFTRCKGDYSVDHILECLNPKYADLVKYREPVEHSKFWSRHVKCVEFIKEHADLADGSATAEETEETKTMGVTAKEIIERAKHYIGYREKDHKSADLESFKADAGDGNYTKFSALCGYGIQPWQWCQLFVCGVAVEVCGSISAAEKLLCDQDLNDGVLTSYTPEGSSYFKQAGRWYTVPQVGDVVYFYSKSMKRICHVGYVETVDTGSKTFGTIEGNTNSDGFTTNGGCVARHSYSYAHVGGTNRVAGFGRPRYAASFKTLSKGMFGDDVKTLQENLKLVGYVDCVYYTSSNFVTGRFDAATEESVKMLQESNGLEVDGVYGQKSNAVLTALVKVVKESSFEMTAADFLKVAKNVADFVRAKGFEYGNAPALPVLCPSRKLTSCDRFVDQVLYEAGLKDVGNRNVMGLEKYLPAKGAEKITDISEISAGDIVKLTYGHVFILGNYVEAKRWERYDCGSPDRIKSEQPFEELIEDFECAFRLPFISNAKKLIKKGQEYSIDYCGRKIEIDGVYGKDSRRNAFACLQKAANADGWRDSDGNELIVDGLKGAKTISAFSSKHYIKLGEEQHMVGAVEIVMYLKGRDPDGYERPGKYGKGLAKAVATEYISGPDILKLVD